MLVANLVVVGVSVPVGMKMNLNTEAISLQAQTACDDPAHIICVTDSRQTSSTERHGSLPGSL